MTRAVQSWLLNWWEWVAVAWVALGLLFVLYNEIAIESKKSFRQESLLFNVSVYALLIAGAPLVFIAIVGIFIWGLYKFLIGKMNVTVGTQAHPSREELLVKLIEIRQRKDSRLRRRERPSRWPVFQLWKEPEAILINTLEDYAWLRDARLSDEAALQQLLIVSSICKKFAIVVAEKVNQLIERKIAAVDPLYPALKDGLLETQIAYAAKWVQDEIKRIKTERPFPPVEWLTKRVSVEEFSEYVTYGGQRKWGDLVQARMVDGDELWEFSSPASYGQGLAGRAGVALARNGRAIAHVVTVMN